MGWLDEFEVRLQKPRHVTLGQQINRYKNDESTIRYSGFIYYQWDGQVEFFRGTVQKFRWFSLIFSTVQIHVKASQPYQFRIRDAKRDNCTCSTWRFDSAEGTCGLPRPHVDCFFFFFFFLNLKNKYTNYYDARAEYYCLSTKGPARVRSGSVAGFVQL